MPLGPQRVLGQREVHRHTVRAADLPAEIDLGQCDRRAELSVVHQPAKRAVQVRCAGLLVSAFQLEGEEVVAARDYTPGSQVKFS